VESKNVELIKAKSKKVNSGALRDGSSAAESSGVGTGKGPPPR